MTSRRSLSLVMVIALLAAAGALAAVDARLAA